MKKGLRLLKRMAALFLMLLLSIESFGAVVSDNDGSAFITKAEFDSLKNDFQSQIDQYNTSIDSKIDGAIAGYLAGIKVSYLDNLTLDTNSQYAFPLTMYSSNTWNDPLNGNFNISVPKTRRIQTRIFWTHHISNAPTSYSNGASVAGRSDMYSNNAIRLGYSYDNVVFDGLKGQMNTLTKQSSTKKLSTATSASAYYTFKRTKTGKGQYDVIYAPNPTTSQHGDGSPYASQKTYYYFYFIGYNDTQVANMAWRGVNTAGQTWTGSGTITGWGYGYSSNIKTPTSAVTSATTATDWCNAMRNGSYPSSAWTVTKSFFGSPVSRVLNWTEDGTNCLFNGSALMPGFIENCWAYTAYVNTDGKKVPVKGIKTSTQSPANTWVFNTSASSQKIYHFTGTNYEAYPQWVAAANSNNAQNSSNNFSQLRASLVYYEDSDGDKHYLDEGMYLNKLTKSGKVKLTLTFGGASGNTATLAFSKKPFGWDRSNSDRIGYKYKLSSANSYTTVESGNVGTVAAGSTYNIEIENLEKNDKLYMCWWQADTSKTFTLSSIDNFQLETAN